MIFEDNLLFLHFLPMEFSDLKDEGIDIERGPWSFPASCQFEEVLDQLIDPVNFPGNGDVEFFHEGQRSGTSWEEVGQRS